MKLLKCFAISILFFISYPLFAQDIRVSGVVSDLSTGEAIPYAAVVLKGTSKNAICDENGNYSFVVPKNGTLIFSFMGYQNLEEPIDGRLIVNAALKSQSVNLDDVVIVAYGVAPKESITGAITQVNSKAIDKRPVSNAVSALEGNVSGVQINNTNGEPGSSPTIRIRGFSTVNGSNAPLYVVDGVPLSGSSSEINANDIESMSILKDAASAALYGNRAANGVILITTKRGQSEKFRIRATVNQGVYTRGIKEYDRLGADQWMETQWLALRNSLMSDPNQKMTMEKANEQASKQFFDTGIYNIYNKSNEDLFDANGKLSSGASIKSQIADDLDWNKGVERVGYRQEYNLSGDGASKIVNFFFSLNYLNEKGYIKTSDFERYTARANVAVTPKKWVKIGLNLTGMHRNSNFTSQSSSTGYANPFYFARNMAPIYPVHAHDLDSADGAYILDEEGAQIYDWGQYYLRAQNNGRHIIYEGELDRDMFTKNSIDGSAFIDINFLKDFKLTVRGSLYNSNSEQRTYNNAIVGDGAGANGRASREQYRYKNYTIQEHLTWNKSFGLNNVDLLLGHENYHTNNTYLYMYKTNETFPNDYNMINFSELTRGYDYENNYKTESYIARARYNYNNKYFVDGSFRRDGSSRFYKSYRWGNFWSAGGSWVISRENWMANLTKQINSLKLRASYGQVGNDQSVGYYGYMSLYALTTNANLAAAYKSQNEAKDIRWESTNSFGIGLEGRFFNLFDLSVEYFDKRSKDLLFDVYLPISTGSTSTSSNTATATKNLGTVSNRGIEVMLNFDLLRKNDWNWSAGLNLTYLKNKILTLPEQNRENGIISGTKKYVEGGGIYDYWMYQFAGVDQMTGNSLFLIDDSKYYGSVKPESTELTQVPEAYLVTINGKDYTTYTTYAKRDWAGSAMPKVFGSFNTSVSWKSLSLNALFTYSLGGKTYDNSYVSLMSVSNSPTAIHKDVLGSWNGVPNGITETSADRINPNGIPVIDGYRNTYTNGSSSTRWLRSSSYLVFKNISLSYNLPQRICNSIDLSALNITFSAENLFSITGKRGMDPQQSFSGVTSNYFTTARVFSLGINVTL